MTVPASAAQTAADPPAQQFECADAEATRALGQRLGRLLRGGDAVALEGSLGAGKTTLVQGIVVGLGSADRVTSPTFTLVNEYSAPELTIYHVDLYRLAEGPGAEVELQVESLGLDEVPGAPDALLLVEWADLLPGLLPADHLKVLLSEPTQGGRTVTFRAPASASRAQAVLLALGSVDWRAIPPPSSPDPHS